MVLGLTTGRRSSPHHKRCLLSPFRLQLDSSFILCCANRVSLTRGEYSVGGGGGAPVRKELLSGGGKEERESSRIWQRRAVGAEPLLHLQNRSLPCCCLRAVVPLTFVVQFFVAIFYCLSIHSADSLPPSATTSAPSRRLLLLLPGSLFGRTTIITPPPLTARRGGSRDSRGLLPALEL